ncbi:hypothetical protein E2I00_012533, partial [Balaenoptera physalus]
VCAESGVRVSGVEMAGLHTGDRTGAGPWRPLLHLPAGGAGAPHQQQSPGQAQGFSLPPSRCWSFPSQ